MSVTALPKKTKIQSDGAQSAQAYVQALRDQAGGMKPFFQLVHGRAAQDNEHITFNNLINRGNYNAEFVGFMVERLNLHGVTMGEFFTDKSP